MSTEQAHYDRKATKSGAVYILTNTLMRAGNFLLVPIYTAFITTEGFGHFSLFVSLATLMTPFLSLAGDAVITRYYFIGEEREGGRGQYLSSIGMMVLINGLLVGGLLLYQGEELIRLIPNLNTSIQYSTLAVATSFSLVWIKTYQRLLKASQDVRVTPVLNLVRFCLQAGVTLVLLLVFDAQESSLMYGFLIAAGSIGVFSLFSYLKEYPPKLHREASKDLVKFTIPLIPNRFAAFAVQPVQNFMIAGLGSAGMLGVFYVGSIFGGVFTLVLQNISEAVQPWLYRNYASEGGRDDDEISDTIYRIGLFVFVGLVLGAGVGVVIIPYIVSEQFEVVAGYFTVFLLFSYANFVKNFAVSVLMYFPGGAKVISIGTYTNIGLMLFFTWLTLEPYGLWGAVWSLGLARYISSEITIYFAQKYSRSSIPFMKLRLMVLGLAAFIAIGCQLMQFSVWWYTALSVLITLIMVGFNYRAVAEGGKFMHTNIVSWIKKQKA